MVSNRPLYGIPNRLDDFRVTGLPFRVGIASMDASRLHAK